METNLNQVEKTDQEKIIELLLPYIEQIEQYRNMQVHFNTLKRKRFYFTRYGEEHALRWEDAVTLKNHEKQLDIYEAEIIKLEQDLSLVEKEIGELLPLENEWILFYDNLHSYHVLFNTQKTFPMLSFRKYTLR